VTDRRSSASDLMYVGGERYRPVLDSRHPPAWPRRASCAPGRGRWGGAV